MASHKPSAVFAKRLREARQKKGWTQDQLARFCTDRLGYPVSRAVESELERPGTTRSKGVKLDDVIAFSYALGVAPLHMITSLVDTGDVEITPRVHAGNRTFREWLRGDLPMGGPTLGDPEYPTDPDFYERQRPAEATTAWRAVEALRQDVAAFVARFPSIPGATDPDDVPSLDEAVLYLGNLERQIANIRTEVKVQRGRLDPKAAANPPPRKNPKVPAVGQLSPDDVVSKWARTQRESK